MINEAFHFDTPQSIVAWQFNREFALYNHKSPLAVIQKRIIQEARRLLEDAGHFGKFFKK